MKSLLESPWLHVALVVLVSSGFESLFVHHSMNLLDEGWPLVAARGLHGGGTLYGDVFWVFPPGHLLAAWIAWALDPPGVVLARVLYAAFTVALSAAAYALGRRFMPAPWALFGALLLAVAAAPAHRYHVVFGYRYLVFAFLVLLAFSQRVRTGDRRWMAVAGVAAGVSLLFRLTPAFAVSVGVGLGFVSLSRDWREWLRDGLVYSGGLLLVVLPFVLWLASDVGLDGLWREAVARPVVMTELQSLPMRELAWGPVHWTRKSIMGWGSAWQFRIYLLLYAVYVGVLLWRAGRTLRAGRAYEQPVLLAFAVFGAIFFVRTLGRSDEPHLYSAIPPMCLLLAHGLWRLLERAGSGTPARIAAAGLCLAVWVFFHGSELFLDPKERGVVPVESVAGRVGVNQHRYAWLVDRSVAILQENAGPDDVVLDLTASPLLLVLAERRGPGGPDLVMPGTFLDPDEERAFVARLEARPPAVVIWPEQPFDGIAERGVQHTAPQLAAWVAAHYVKGPVMRFGRTARSPLRWSFLFPRAGSE